MFEIKRKSTFLFFAPHVMKTSSFLEEIYKGLVNIKSQKLTLYRASMGWGNESLPNCLCSHDQDGRHAHIR